MNNKFNDSEYNGDNEDNIGETFSPKKKKIIKIYIARLDYANNKKMRINTSYLNFGMIFIVKIRKGKKNTYFSNFFAACLLFWIDISKSQSHFKAWCQCGYIAKKREENDNLPQPGVG
jgi:hypothetical protein